jgi:hypothetical protein
MWQVARRSFYGSTAFKFKSPKAICLLKNAEGTEIQQRAIESKVKSKQNK